MAQEKDTNKEQLILETAERLFLDKGFAMTSTTEIAKEVGCNQAMVHYYYRTKEKLFQAIFEKKVRLMFSSLFNPIDENISFEERLKNMIESHFEIIKANPKIPFLLFNELTTNPKRLEAIVKESGLAESVINQFNKELQAEIKKGTIRPISPMDLLLSIVYLNIILFIAKPLLETVLSISEDDYKKLIEKRKQENVLIILRSLKP